MDGVRDSRGACAERLRALRQDPHLARVSLALDRLGTEWFGRGAHIDSDPAA